MPPGSDLGETLALSTTSGSDDDQFHSPEADYSRDFTRRIENPFETTLIAGTKAPVAKPQPTARKSTGRAGTNRRFSATPKRKAPVKHHSAAVKRNQKMLREILRLQNSTDNMVPRLPFARLVRELIRKCSSDVDRVTPVALMALQESTEMYMTQQLQDAYMLTLHRGRVTLSVKDMELLRRLCRG